MLLQTYWPAEGIETKIVDLLQKSNPSYKHIDPLRGLRPSSFILVWISFISVTNILTRWGDWDFSFSNIAFIIVKLQTYWPAEGIETSNCTWLGFLTCAGYKHIDPLRGLRQLNCISFAAVILKLQTYWPAEGIETVRLQAF